MTSVLDALDTLAQRLQRVATSLDDDQVVASAYPEEWTIADTFSHLGSGAVIMQRRIEDAVAGAETSPDFAQSVWDEWNDKAPRAQVIESVVANLAFNEAAAAIDDDVAARLEFSMGPMRLDLNGFLGLRVNEVAVHIWDVEVVADPSVTVDPVAVETLLGGLAMIAGFSGRARGVERTLHVSTTDPAHAFAISLGSQGVAFGPAEPGHSVDVVLPAEALVRLVYGRLDPAHTPDVTGGDHLEELRAAFPGF